MCRQQIGRRAGDGHDDADGALSNTDAPPLDGGMRGPRGSGPKVAAHLRARAGFRCRAIASRRDSDLPLFRDSDEESHGAQALLYL